MKQNKQKKQTKQKSSLYNEIIQAQNSRTNNRKQKTSQKKYKTEIKIVTNPELGFEFTARPRGPFLEAPGNYRAR